MSVYKEILPDIENELHNIFKYWSTIAYNADASQFYGEIDHFGRKMSEANLGIIMYSRILWSFSAAASYYNSNLYTSIANETCNFLNNYFLDTDNGGYYWELSVDRVAVVNKKQTYAQAFVLYGLCELYARTKKSEILNQALELFHLIENRCIDFQFGGYSEAFAIDWNSLTDVRLSHKEMNYPKSLNTNLHVLEAYTRLLQVSANSRVKEALEKLIHVFVTHIIDEKGHLKLFFNEKWESRVDEYSYGHDIECSWLLWEALEALNDKFLREKNKSIVIKMADTFLNEGLDCKRESSLYHKCNETGIIDTDRHWWVQCEALEGLANAYEISKHERFREHIPSIWKYINEKLIDRENGEWFWRVDNAGLPITIESKVCNWKAPYHNSRALMRVAEKIRKW